MAQPLHFVVTGMHCNHCRNSVMRIVGNLSGVESVEVDLASGAMQVVGSASAADVVKAVEALGFGIAVAHD